MQMFRSSIFKTAFYNTFYFAIITVIAKNILGLLFAVILNGKLKLTNLHRSIIFVPALLSPLVVSVIFNAIYHPADGILNAFLNKVGLSFMAREWLNDPATAMNAVIAMDIWSFVGTHMVIYLAALQAVPRDYYEAAMVDGASPFQRLVKITIPLIFHAITVNTLLAIIGGLKVFGQVYGLTNGGPFDSTQVLGTFLFKSFGEGMLGYSSAVGLFFTLLICTISFVVLAVMRRMEVEY
ncbi:carbohydrate ABC transporter permease [Cohnella silvisoli]|uniref:Sugar ABC transporter permease n=1 Tax=Cohnella silvisoli TaxID=2873699 RepID=A0ABV1KSV8_9BACL|nr:sugar ABC transporter permease [Cohnella silvisoli]MCD9021452.1 sugar ABC transporter permease [Cohnella silvisoli]